MKRYHALLIIPLLIFSLSGLSSGKSKQEIDVKIKIKGRMQRTVAKGVILARSDLIWKVLTDFDNHEKFMPSVVESSILESKEGSFKVSKTLHVAAKKIPYIVTIRVEKPMRKYTWRQYEGPFVLNSGSWELEPNGPHTKVTYVSEVEPRFYIPGWIKTTMVNKTIPRLFESIEEETLRRNGLQPR